LLEKSFLVRKFFAGSFPRLTPSKWDHERKGVFVLFRGPFPGSLWGVSFLRVLGECDHPRSFGKEALQESLRGWSFSSEIFYLKRRVFVGLPSPKLFFKCRFPRKLPSIRNPPGSLLCLGISGHLRKSLPLRTASKAPFFFRYPFFFWRLVDLCRNPRQTPRLTGPP